MAHIMWHSEHIVFILFFIFSFSGRRRAVQRVVCLSHRRLTIFEMSHFDCLL